MTSGIADRESRDPATALATTFRRDEVEGLLQLMRAIDEGRDLRLIARSNPLVTLRAKFQRLRNKAART